jgi:hypothetical protein
VAAPIAQQVLARYFEKRDERLRQLHSVAADTATVPSGPSAEVAVAGD